VPGVGMAVAFVTFIVVSPFSSASLLTPSGDGRRRAGAKARAGAGPLAVLPFAAARRLP